MKREKHIAGGWYSWRSVGLVLRRLITKTRIIGLGAAVIFSTSGLAQAESEAIQLGVMGPFTGPAALSGEGIQKGARMAVEDAKNEGLLPLKIDGVERNVELVWVDSQSSPEKAVKAVNDAVHREGVDFLTSGWHSSVAMAVMEAEAPMNIVHIGHGGESQAICDKINQDPEKYRGWHKGVPSPKHMSALYGPPLQHFMDSGLWNPQTMKAAVVVEDSDYGRDWGDALETSLKNIGFDVLPYDAVPLDETEFTSLLTKYKAQNVAIVGMTITGNVSATNLVKQMHQQRLPAVLIGHGLTWFGDWYGLTSDASNYVITMDSPRVIAPYQEEWIDRYVANYGEEPSVTAAGQQGYDYTMAALKILQEAETLDFDELVKVTRSIDHQGVWQRINFADEDSDCPGQVIAGGFEEGFYYGMVQLIDGETISLWPLDYAEADFQEPAR